ncbi:hypothetical protein [Lapidilactobacillus salsurivasis]
MAKLGHPKCFDNLRLLIKVYLLFYVEVSVAHRIFDCGQRHQDNLSKSPHQ